MSTARLPPRVWLTLFVLAGLIWSVLQLRPLDEVDLFLHIAKGQLILDDLALPEKEVFSYTHFGERLLHPVWLAEVLFAAILRWLGGWVGIRAIHGMVFSLAIAVAVGAAVKVEVCRGRAPRVVTVILVALICFVVGLSNSSIRAQGFGFLCFCCFVALMSRPMAIVPRIFALVVLSVLWQQLHPSLALGLLVVASYAGGSLIEFVSQRDRPSFLKCVGYSLLFLALFPLQILSPLGASVFSWGEANVYISREVLGISEWMPPWHPAVRGAVIPFWIVFVCLVPFLRALWRSADKQQLVAMMIFTGITFYAARYALFWGVVIIPLLLLVIEQVLPSHLFRTRCVVAVPRVAVIQLVLATGACCAIAFAVSLRAVYSPFIPLIGIDVLKQERVKGRIYNYREWAGPLVFFGFPSWQVAIDGRLFLYPAQEWAEYNQAALGLTPLGELTAKHAPAAFFLHRGFQEGLIKEIQRAPDWRKVFDGDDCVIFVRAAVPSPVPDS